MLRNPACPDMYFSDGEAESYQRYRYYIIHKLKKLQYLDATPVDATERKEAEMRGAFCKIARPSGPVSPQPIAEPIVKKSSIGVAAGGNKPIKVATFLAKGKPRYDGTNSEGNRFIMNDDL